MLMDKGAICAASTGAMEAHKGLPLLDLVIQDEARSEVQRLWILGRVGLTFIPFKVIAVY
jgi:hypothetical protein